MPLAKMSELYDIAIKHNTSILAFDANDLGMIASVIAAADAVNKPVIVMMYPAIHKMISFAAFAAAVKDLAAKAKVPIGLHLDHCSNYEMIIGAIKDGFTSVMADGSSLPFDENVAFTASVVKTAHVFDVAVEGELGHVGTGAQTGDYQNKDLFTRPEEAARFSELTHVDALAVAFGSAHGVYKSTPRLDLERLRQINAATETPLVLHGGSGIPNDQLDKAFTLGINKFNIGTEFFFLNFESKKKFWSQNPDISKMGEEEPFVRNALKESLMKKLELCRA
jgi:fructose-bisphosphate aldolase class II/tagatose 1,6-diphosphate aldolase GatY/KbaY